MTISRTFCVAPWIHVAISTRGIFRPCCNISYMKEDYLNGGRFTDHYVYKENIEDVWNSDTYKEFRKKMIRGEKLPNCSRCYREEESGIISARMSLNDTYLQSLGNVNLNGSCSLNSIKYIDVRLGNKCNLKCRMCNPYASDQWIADEHLIHIRRASEEDLVNLKKMDWFEQNLFWDNLSLIMGNCEILYFSGGEPTLFTERKYKLFDKCIENGIAKNITLRYNTNITVLPPKLIDYWKHFHKVRINCSIDGFDKVNDYIRYPSKWKLIDKNLRLLHEMQKKSLVKLSVHATVQMYNIFGLVDLFDYLQQFDIFPFLNILNHPSKYNIRVLNKRQKDQVSSILNDWYNKNKEHLEKYDKERHHEKLLQVIKYMYREDWNHLYKDFQSEAYTLDKLRNQKLKDYIPELERI